MESGDERSVLVPAAQTQPEVLEPVESEPTTAVPAEYEAKSESEWEELRHSEHALDPAGAGVELPVPGLPTEAAGTAPEAPPVEGEGAGKSPVTVEAPPAAAVSSEPLVEIQEPVQPRAAPLIEERPRSPPPVVTPTTPRGELNKEEEVKFTPVGREVPLPNPTVGKGVDLQVPGAYDPEEPPAYVSFGWWSQLMKKIGASPRFRRIMPFAVVGLLLTAGIIAL